MTASAQFDPFLLMFSAAAVGQAVLCTLVLAGQVPARVENRRLAVIFLLLAILAAGPIVGAVSRSLLPYFMGLVLAALYTLPAAIWFYVTSLTAKRSTDVTTWRGWHLLGPLAGFAGALAILTLPGPDLERMFVMGEAPPGLHPALVAIFLFGLVLFWNGLSAVYVWKSLTHLHRYRQGLHDQFSNNDRRELLWLSAVVSAIGLVWITSVILLILDNLVVNLALSDVWGAMLVLVLVLAFAVRGLGQKAGYADRELPPEESDTSALPRKYSKSALSVEQAQRIAGRLDKAMQTDQLFLDPSLSLHKLAKHIGVAPNLVSQTLNQTLNETFFDYVNRWRIEAALPSIASDAGTILAIALDVGFNTRSTFYSAFKSVTGTTPRDYRRMMKRAVPD